MQQSQDPMSLGHEKGGGCGGVRDVGKDPMN